MDQQTVVKCEHCHRFVPQTVPLSQSSGGSAPRPGTKVQCTHCGKLTSADNVELVSLS